MAYQGQRGWNPVGLGAAIAINGAVLALLTTMATTTIIHSDPWKPLEAVNIRVLPPPLPPETPKPVERAVTDPAPVPLPYIPPAPRPAPGPVIQGVDILPPMPVPSSVTAATGGTGTGNGTAGVGVTTPLPVLVAASVDPRYRADFQPDYPAFERNQGRDGTVVVRVLVGGDGRVAAIERVRATSDAFFEATKRRALSKWRFRAATRDGVAVESWREMTVRFTMADG